MMKNPRLVSATWARRRGFFRRDLRSDEEQLRCYIVDRRSRRMLAQLRDNAPVQRRFQSSSSSSLAYIQSWFLDAVRARSFHPTNPILESITGSIDGTVDDEGRKSHRLPDFGRMLPYHLESAAREVQIQYQNDLQALEERLSSSPAVEQGSQNDSQQVDTVELLLLRELDRIQAPLGQVQNVATLYTTLASPPDQIREWQSAAAAVRAMTRHLSLRLYQSTVIYHALTTGAAASRGGSVPSAVLSQFHRQGVHLSADAGDAANDDDGEDDDKSSLRDQLRGIHGELTVLNDRLQKVETYEGASKAVRLQCVSDMYNVIGLTALHASKMDDGRHDSPHGALSPTTITDTGRMVTSVRTELIEGLFPDIVSFLQPHLPQRTKLNLEGAGAFLENNKPAGAKSRPVDAAADEEQRALWQAKKRMKDCLRLHGVLRGVADFCDAIFGIRVVDVEQTSSDPKGDPQVGWNKNVRLLHLYQKVRKDTTADDATDDIYLGAIFLDPFRDMYWRTEDAKDLVTTQLFSKYVHQTEAPVVVMALKINPTWDDSPTPMTWSDLRDLLFQFGKALQLILEQNGKKMNIARQAPLDGSEFMAHFMEMWIQNDGFLHRLAQLSDDTNVVDDSMLEALRKDVKKEKALDIVNTIFLSALQLAALKEFDPRGDETLVTLQSRLANHYLPKGILPDSSDLSPLLAVFQENGIDQNMSAYAPLWSEILSAMVFHKFQNTDLRDRDEVERLGRGLRDLFLRSDQGLTTEAVEDLCQSQLSSDPLKEVYQFGLVESEDTLKASKTN